MVQVKIEEQEYYNSIRVSCGLHDLMRELALSKAEEEEEFIKVIDIRESPVELLSFCTKQLVIYVGWLAGDFPSVQNLELLQTLKLDCMSMWAVGDLRRWTATELRNMGRLQHLVLPSISTSETSPKIKLRFDRLSKLETVENFDSRLCEVKDLPELVNLRKLTVIVVSSKEDLTEVLKYLQDIDSTSSYTCIRYLSLTIKWYHLSKQRNASIILRMLICDPSLHLQELVLEDSIPELVQLVDLSLCHITSLKLYGSAVEQDIMPVLERIPVSRTLVLGKNAVMAKEMVCSAEGFPKLISLKLYFLENLERWSLEEGSMPNLANLVIQGCPKLENIPEGLRFLKSLAKVEIIRMPTDLCERVKVKGTDFYKVAHVPSFFVKDMPDFPLDMNKFKELVNELDSYN